MYGGGEAHAIPRDIEDVSNIGSQSVTYQVPYAIPARVNVVGTITVPQIEETVHGKFSTVSLSSSL